MNATSYILFCLSLFLLLGRFFYTNWLIIPLLSQQSTLRDAVQQVQEAGFHICLPVSDEDVLDETIDDDEILLLLGVPICGSSSVQRRGLLSEIDDEQAATSNVQRYLVNAFAAVLCVGVAALAAGLTLGMLGLDPLLLLIKERAADQPSERAAASQLLPVVQQHHRLLVTLLLMNAVANEALPLFLEQLVSPAIAVAVSVTLVLFFGEIIPSAVFTGPNQLKIACSLVPVVKAVLWLLYPIAGPIAALLDWLLHDLGDNDDEHAPSSSAAYTRGELAALIRIQYEERVAVKRKRKLQRKSVVPGNHVGALDFTPVLLSHQQSLRALKNQAEHGLVVPAPLNGVSSPLTTHSSDSGEFYSGQHNNDHNNHDDEDAQSSRSIHKDEVTMVEGALQMQTKVALDVFTPMRRVFSIPSDMLLNERNMVKIYASGYSRIPVHEPGLPTAIVGVLVTKMLIVVNPKEARPVHTLPLRSPRCISPAMPLVHLLNMFQSGGSGSRGGHLALVCARPSAGEKAMAIPGESLPETAGLMGIITLEDVLEMLLQEQIYDEMDKRERKALKLAIMVVGRWRRYVQRKKEGLYAPAVPAPQMLPVVQRAMATARAAGNDPTAVEDGLASATEVAETTALLLRQSNQQNYSGQ
jgi:metal transporter CNNM